MLREPKKVQHQSKAAVGQKSERFRFVKLEERIAPACHTNPHGKKVGCGHHGYV